MNPVPSTVSSLNVQLAIRRHKNEQNTVLRVSPNPLQKSIMPKSRLGGCEAKAEWWDICHRAQPPARTGTAKGRGACIWCSLNHQQFIYNSVLRMGTAVLFFWRKKYFWNFIMKIKLSNSQTNWIQHSINSQQPQTGKSYYITVQCGCS